MEVTPKAVKINAAYSEESSPCEYKEEGRHHPKLSASLRERLKRSRRSFTSPLSVAKRLCVDDLEEDGQQVPAEVDNNLPVIVQSVDVNKTETISLSERFSGPVPETSSEDTVQQLRREIKKKTETLRRLKMVKMYRSKNDLTQLQTLIDKWRSCSQAALYELQSGVPIDGRKGSLSELIDLFNLDDTILHFDRTEEDFTS